ncbi:MAG: hypothetical protein R3C10_23475 [Pirellulales bacterium]
METLQNGSRYEASHTVDQQGLATGGTFTFNASQSNSTKTSFDTNSGTPPEYPGSLTNSTTTAESGTAAISTIGRLGVWGTRVQDASDVFRGSVQLANGNIGGVVDVIGGAGGLFDAVGDARRLGGTIDVVPDNRVLGQFDTFGHTAPSSSNAKEIFIDSSKYPQSLQHLEDAGALNRPLTVNRADAAANRAAALRGRSKVPGMDLDEVPPAVLRQPGDPVSVRPILRSDNRGAGASMGNQMRGVPNGGQVIIRPKRGG